MIDQEVTARIDALFAAAKETDDYSAIEALVEEADNFRIDKYAFGKAVELGCLTYVDDHAEDSNVELNDPDEGYCTWLYSTDNQEIIQCLRDHGAWRQWDDFRSDEFLFAYETNCGYILALDDDFQKEVLKAYLDQNGLTEQDIIDFFEAGDGYEAPEDADYDLEEDLSALGVTFDDGKITFFFPDDEWAGRAFCDVMESLGWDTEFEGDSWKLETIGVYYIERG